jgi:hypothetical protein
MLFNIFTRKKVEPRQLLYVADRTLVPAHLIGVPENMERFGHVFSNKELGRLADIAKRYKAYQSLQSWQETLVTSFSDGVTLTAAAAATALQPVHKITLPNQYLSIIGKMMKITVQGRISCVVTTPGTARFDIRLGGVQMHDTGAMNLNIVAKTNLPFWLEMVFTIRAVGNGTTANAFGFSQFTSEAVVGSPLNTAGGNGTITTSGGGAAGATAVGAGFDSTAANSVDLFFTQTVATGSMTINQYKVEALN